MIKMDIELLHSVAFVVKMVKERQWQSTFSADQLLIDQNTKRLSDYVGVLLHIWHEPPSIRRARLNPKYGDNYTKQVSYDTYDNRECLSATFLISFQSTSK